MDHGKAGTPRPRNARHAPPGLRADADDSATRAAVSRAQTLPTVQGLVDQLAASFREQLRRALHVQLDGSETSLAFVDHYLRLVHDEDRLPIVALLAAGAGAYFGEVVREHLGATWIGDGRDPRRLRLLLTHQFLYFSPVDQAYEAIAGRSLDGDDPRIPDGAPFDPAFALTPPRGDERDEGALPGEHDEDAAWLQERLSELAPVPEDEFVSLTCRFETLKLMLELLAAKHGSEGKRPRQYTMSDYLEAMGA
jgi:hypothetical protein